MARCDGAYSSGGAVCPVKQSPYRVWLLSIQSFITLYKYQGIRLLASWESTLSVTGRGRCANRFKVEIKVQRLDVGQQTIFNQIS